MDCQPSDLIQRVTSENPSTIVQREQLAALLKALSHPARLQIIEFLSTVTTCFCGDIVQQLPLAQSTVSQHMKILKDAGLVKGEIDRPRTCYWLDRDTLALLKKQIALLP